MAKRSQQRPARQKNGKSGCMWGIISMFDFHHDRTPRRLLSHRSRSTDNNTHGPPYPTSEVNLPTNSPGMRPSIKDGEKVKKPTFDHMRKRVKEITEEKMFINQDTKTIRKNHEHKHISKPLKKYFDEEISISHQAQKTSQYNDLEALVREILLIYRERNEQHGDLGTGAKRSFPIVEEKLLTAIEALLNEKSRNGDHKKFHHSKEMCQMLSSNKEMLLKIIQDQNLILLNEDQKSKSNSKGQERSQGPAESLIRKHRKISRMSKSQENIPLYKDTIVILKPGCAKDQVQMRNEAHSDENGSQLSFVKVRGRLKHAMGNEQLTSGPIERTGKRVDGGWSSPNRDHFYTERFARITNRLKTGDRCSKSCETETRSENAENQISNIYVEAKKHISEMLTSGDEDAESMKRSIPALSRSLGRILSFQEYNSLSPGTSPRAQARSMVIKSQLITTRENHEGKIVVLDNVTCEGDQETVKSPSCDKELEKQSEGREPRASLAEDHRSESLESDLPENNKLSSSRNRNEHSVASKTEEPEPCPEKPSPISVLELVFLDDDTTPARTASLPSVQPRCIKFEEFVSGAEDHQIRITDSGDNEESAFEYVEAVLLSSDLKWSEFETRWMSSVQILDPSLFVEVETFSGRAKHDQKLLFDSTNEALEDVCNLFIPESSFIKRNVWPVPKGMDLINEVWSRVESCLCKLYPRDVNELIRNDMGTTRMWLDLQTGLREVVIELEGSIFEETIDDILLNLFTGR